MGAVGVPGGIRLPRMVLTAVLTVLSGALAALCLAQVMAGREFVRMTRGRRPAAQVRREYGAVFLTAVGALLTCLGAGWWGIALVWVGIALTVAVSTRTRREQPHDHE